MDRTSTPQEHAEALLAYFERLVHESGKGVWVRGAETAREWLRLINNRSIAQDEVATFLGVVRANRHITSGWFDLALGVYGWAKQEGLDVPSYEEFFHSNMITSDQMIEMPVHEFAIVIGSCFEEKVREDPGHAMWGHGLIASQKWLNLIEAQLPAQDDLINFINFVNDNGYWQAWEWFCLACKICEWAMENGYSAFLPDGFRARFE